MSAITKETPNVERWGWYSLGINVILTTTNLIIASLSGSLAVAAEMVHNFVDLLSAAAVVIGLKLANRKSKDFPYGLYKLENVVAVVMSFLIFFTAYEILKDAFFTPKDDAETTVELWMLVGTALSMVLPLAFSVFEMRAGKASGSPVLQADAREYRVHVFTGGMVFAALAGHAIDFPLDRVAAVIIVIAIVKTGWESFKDGMRVLLDASLDLETLDRIRDIIHAEPAVIAVEWITGDNAGRFRFVEAGIVLRVTDLEKAEHITNRIEGKIGEAIANVERVVIHADPPQRDRLLYAIPLKEPGGALADHIGEAPYFALATIRQEDGAVEDQRIISNPHLIVEKRKGIIVSEWLVGQKIDVMLTAQDMSSRGATYALSDAGVEIRTTQAKTLQEALQNAA